MITLNRFRWWELGNLYALYRTAFPANERKPFGTIVKMAKAGRADLWAIRSDGVLAGLVATVNSPEVVLLDYLAVSKKYRGWGIGTAALRTLMEQYPALFVEIESTYMVPLEVEADVFGVRMELLSRGCSMDFEGYRSFYREHYSPWAAEHIREVQP